MNDNVMCGRPSPARWMKSRSPQARQPGRGLAAEISACSFVHTSNESRVRRSSGALAPPTRSLSASVAAIDATRFTAELRMPEVSQVSTMPRGESGKMQARQAVAPEEVESARPVAGVDGIAESGAVCEKIANDGGHRESANSGAAEQRPPSEAKIEVLGDVPGKLLRIQERPGRQVVAGKFAAHQVDAKTAQPA